MKRRIRFLTITLILIVFCTTAFAENAVVVLRGENGFPGYGAIISVVAADDTVYIGEFYEEKLFVHQIGEDESVAYAYDDNLSTLALCVDEDGTLYRIATARSEDGNDIDDIALYRVELSDSMIARSLRVVSLSWQGFIYYADGIAQSQEVASCVIERGELFAVLNTEDGKRLICFDLQTGESVDAGLKNVYEVKAFRDCTLLILRFDTNSDTAYVESYNPALGVAQEITAMGRDDDGNRPVGLCYDTEGERILYTYGGEVRAHALSDDADIRVTSMPLVTNMLDAVYLPNRYLPFNNEALVSLDITCPSADVRTLRVYSELARPSRNAVTHYLTENPNVDLIYASGIETTNDLISMLITQNQDIDVFSLNTGSSDLLTRLIDKGYAARVNSESCLEFTDGLYPILQNAVTREGNLYALPTSVIMAECFGINRQAFFDAGFTEGDIPRTWPEFIDFIARWASRGISESDFILLDLRSLSGMGLKTVVVAMLLTSYETYMTADDIVGYDTDLFRGLLNKVMEIDFDAFSPIYSGNVEYEPDSDVPALFTSYYYPSVINDDSPFTYLPLTLADGMEAYVTVACTALAVNVYSPDQDIATAFLECLMNDIEKTEKANMSPNYLEVLIRPDDYEYMMFQSEQLLKEVEALYESAENGDEKEHYALAVQGVRDARAEYANFYLTSEESVAEYRTAMEHAVFYVNRNPEIVTNENVNYFSVYRERLLSGQITVDEFISFLTETRIMQMLEEQ